MENRQNRLCVGVGREDITPKIGTLLYGYNPHNPSTSVHDGLNVTAVYLSQGDKDALMLTVTVGDLQTELNYELAQKISLQTGIRAGHILIAATHTHSAPNVAGMEGWGEIDREYVDDILLPASIKASQNAVNTALPAEIAYGSTDSEVGVNRRQVNEDGSVGFGQNPWGTFDGKMTVMLIRNAQTKQGIVNIIHYGCHGTAAGCNTEITRDWSGVMCDRVEKLTGTVTAFYNGAIGDQGPRLSNGKTVGDITYVEELGAVAATDAMRACRNHTGFEEASLKLFTETYRLPYKPLPSLNEVEQSLARIKNPETLVNIERLTYCHLCEVKAYLESNPTQIPDALELPATIVAVGKVLFVPLPFEVFSGISLRLREYLKNEYPFVNVLSNAGGYYCYLPTQDQLCMGGYEVECFLHSDLFLLKDDTDNRLISQVLEIVRSTL